jgi:endonuclease-3
MPTNRLAPGRRPRRESRAAKKERVRAILDELARLYGDARCALDYADALQLLIATILSAQCTDKRVNLVTPALFRACPDAAAFATIKDKELQKLIKTTGFFRNKAKNIIACCKQIVEQHGGRVPGTMEELTLLAGVGRKTANVILGNAFDVPGIPVDTHVARLSQRMALTVHADPVKIERDLNELVPQSEWTMFGHRMIYHGRQVCHARTPRCAECTLASLCPKIVDRKPARSASDGSRG